VRRCSTDTDDPLEIEVVHALAEEQIVVRLRVPPGTTAGEAIERSGLERRYPGVQAPDVPVGIHGRRVARSTRLRSGDRVEIYRPLTADPKQARHRRAARRS
jgi:uncharacterized protein